MGGVTPRTWTAVDRDLLDQVGQALRAGRQQHQLQVENQQQQALTARVQQSMIAQDQADDPRQLIADALSGLVEVLSVPAAAVVLWEADQAEIVACVASLPDFELTQNTPIDVGQDTFIQRLLASGSPQMIEGRSQNIIQVPVHDLAPETRAWLNSPALGQVLAMPMLETDLHQPVGAVIFCDRRRTWEPRLVEAAAMLVRHLARRHRSMSSLKHYSEQLESLNCQSWYQYRQIERHCQTALTHQQKLQTCWEDPAAQALLTKSQAAIEAIEQSMQADSGQIPLDEASLPVASLLRQSLARVETLANQRQLWTQVHNLTSNSTATGVNPKLGLVLYELLLAACYRSQAGQRIDIWCRLANLQWLELSITDQGAINPQLIADLSNPSITVSSTLNSPPGKHLRACQTLLKKLGGQLEFSQLDDGRVLSRLMLPLKV